MKTTIKNYGIKKKTIVIITAMLITALLLIYGAFQLFESRAEKYYLLGKAYETQGYYNKAIDSYEKSVNIRQDSVVYNALGNLEELLGDDVGSISAYQKGISANRNDIENYFDLARAYLKIKEYSRSEDILMQSIGTGNETASIYALLGTTYIEMKKWDKAETALKKSLDMQERATTYNDLGVVYESSGRINLAIENYKKALTINPNLEMAKNNLERFGAN